jgi:DNA polymerase (family 10)
VRPLLGAGLPAVLAVRDQLAASPLVDKISEAGSVRRRRETFRDLDLIATSKDPAALTDAFTRLPWVVETAAHGETKATVLSSDGLRFDLRVVPPESYGNLLQHFTGSKDHNVALRERAVKQGLSVSEYSITVVESGEELRYPTEEEVYDRLGYQWIPPELRENAGELEAARRGELPALVELGDVKGDLHLHSTWSDGKASLEQMAFGARARGYAYMAITDHSQRLREGRLAAQDEEVAALNERLAPFRILRGVEVNIRVDGSIDLAEEELATRDWVVASLHNSFDKNPSERLLAAMDNPYVDCIGHPTTRKINKRLPAELDIDRVIEKALETGTFLEINGQPDRLDLRDTNARAAGEAGLKLLLSSDGHSAAALAYLELAVSQARRAWLTKEQVLNTRSWAQLAKLRKKR